MHYASMDSWTNRHSHSPNNWSADLLTKPTNLLGSESFTISSLISEEDASTLTVLTLVTKPEFFLCAAKNSPSHHKTDFKEAKEAYRGKSSFPPMMPGQIVSCNIDCWTY